VTSAPLAAVSAADQDGGRQLAVLGIRVLRIGKQIVDAGCFLLDLGTHYYWSAISAITPMS